MIHQEQLRELIVIPTLKALDEFIPYSDNAVELLMMTQAHESNGGYFLKQEGGPALGIYQMEPATHFDIWENYLNYMDNDLPDIVSHMAGCSFGERENHLFDLVYATAMARVHYYRDPEPLPDGDIFHGNTLWSLAKYAKRVWNTDAGKATVRDYHDKYLKYCVNWE